MKDENDFYGLGDLFYRVLSKYIASERIPKDFGIKCKLYPSEIHMVHAIGKNTGINVTELATYLGITKGAVPKMIKKLSSKGLVESYKSINNKKEVYLKLTAEGKKAQKGYLQYHKERNLYLKRLYNKLTKDEIELITNVLKEVGRFADKILEE
jgi:DNA-binding MarR family transcriptional regulator